MTQNRLSDEIRTYLGSHFPGSSVDDSYYFVTLQGGARRHIIDDPFELLQRVADRLCERQFWLVAVGMDPREFVEPRVVEQEATFYQPDWNVDEKLTQWFVAAAPAVVDLKRMLASLKSPAALVFIDPARRIVFDAVYRDVFATSEQDLNEFFSGIESSIQPEA
jgi:hypothetical protein